MSECKHPTCGDTCRREKKPKKLYRLNRSPKPKRTAIGAMEEMDRADLLKIAISTLHNYVRLRDAAKGCISCKKGKVEEAGHYFPAGKYSGVRLDEINVNGQCKACNCLTDGNLEEYMNGMKLRYGVDALMELELRAMATKVYKWSRAELIDIITEFRNKTKELKDNDFREGIKH